MKITDWGLVSLSKAIHARHVSCHEVMTAYLEHIDHLNPLTNALVGMVAPEQLLAQARDCDLLLHQNSSRGVLHGIPQAPKDNLPAAGLLTTKGSPIFANQRSTADAVSHARARSSGAIFIGRTNAPEFSLGGHTYNPVYGTTRNAFDQNRSAGGSSGGAGVAVALHMLPAADGSDMMGSLRTPAAFNNVFGLRTTPGVIPHGPGEEIFLQQFSVSGPMARNIPDLAMLLGVHAGFDQKLPLTRRSDDVSVYGGSLERDFVGTRIGWLGDMNGHLPFETGMLEVCQAALSHFQDIGCIVEAIHPEFDLEKLWNAWLNLRSFTFTGGHSSLYMDANTRPFLKSEAVWEIERGMSLTGQDVYEASRVRSAWYETMRKLFHRFDYLVIPSTQVFPFDVDMEWPRSISNRSMDSYHRWLEVVVPATMASLPALSVPAGFGSTGLPAGLQLMAPTQQDWSLLQLGHAYDQSSGYAQQHSKLLTD